MDVESPLVDYHVGVMWIIPLSIIVHVQLPVNQVGLSEHVEQHLQYPLVSHQCPY